MLFTYKSPSEKRADLKMNLKSGKFIQMPGAFSPLVALEIEAIGFEGVYISGAVMSADLGLPDIGLTTLNEVAHRGNQIARVTNLPCIIDADTGFGEPMNIARTVQILEEAGVAGMHLEDQIHPKRCGHLDNKILCSNQEMEKRIRAAVLARKDPNFLIIARTDARASEGMSKTIQRIKAYSDAGAEVIFPEALQSEQEFEQIRENVDIYLLANMTEFGKSPILTAKQLEKIGFNLVIYPVTTWRLALGATVDGLKEIKQKGHQKDLISKMQTRKELYERLKYEQYIVFDQDIFNFKF